MWLTENDWPFDSVIGCHFHTYILVQKNEMSLIKYLDNCTTRKDPLTIIHRLFFSSFIFITGSKVSHQMSRTMQIKLN